MKHTALLISFVIASATPLFGQPERKPLAFEVASVKPNNSPSSLTSRGGTPNLYEVTNAPLRFFVRAAYGVMDFELTGGPGWIDSQRFDVIGKLPAGTGRPQVPQMLRQLLAERFRLVVHTETRTVPTFDLVVAGSDRPLGPNLLKTDLDCAAVIAALQSGSQPAATLPPQQRGRAPKCGMLEGPGVISLSGTTMTQFSTILSRRVNRRVFDRTGLTDRYDIELHFAQDSAANNGSDEAGLFTALQEQLGLKLEATRSPVDVLVIDHVERPTPD